MKSNIIGLLLLSFVLLSTPAVKAQDVDVPNNLTMRDSTGSTVGNILKGPDLFLHNFGLDNTFIGKNAGNFTLDPTPTGAVDNTGVGVSALSSLTTGRLNTAFGVGALLSNDTGNDNTASGFFALRDNTAGTSNTASGVQALQSNITGIRNTATGRSALLSNTSGNQNTANGHNALINNTGSDNAALGFQALFNKTFGDDNIAIGTNAGANLPSGFTNIYIGHPGPTADESNTIRIGRPIGHNRFFAAGVTGVPVGGAQVFVNSDGQLGVAASSRRFKEEVRDMGEGSSRLRQLRPVSFYYKQDKQVQAGAPRQLQYGLIAEEVAAVYPELVEYSETGEPFSVRYHFLAPMLLNEVQKQDRQIQEQRQQIHEQAAQIAELKEQAAENAELKARLEKLEGIVRNVAYQTAWSGPTE